jgi:hypothetical protein
MRARPSTRDDRLVVAEFEVLLVEQHEVFTRAQARRLGVSNSAIRAQLVAHRWQRVSDGVIVAHNGPLDGEATLWAALLGCGAGALISHDSAAYAQGLLVERPAGVHVTVPNGRKVVAPSGVVVHRTRHQLKAARGRTPPQVSVEDTVLDRAELASNPDQVVALVVTAISRRVTTATGLAAALAARKRARWRDLLRDLLDDGTGIESPLEWRYHRDVERPHGVPAGERQAVVSGGSERRDIVYDPWRVITELDGRLGHTGVGAFKDMRRDNAALTRGEVRLRYGWADVASRPCEVAAQVALVLGRNGWPGSLRRCPRCPAR